MIIICGKTYYNLEEAVKRLSYLIGRSTDVVKNVVGQVDSANKLPNVTSVNVGDTYAVGAESPYNYYVSTGAEWLDLGQFPLQGDPGTDGLDGRSIWYSVNDSETTLSQLASTTLYNPEDYEINVGDLIVTASGNLYSITAINGDVLSVIFRVQLKGQKGDKGEKGDSGAAGGAVVVYMSSLSTSEMPDFETAVDPGTIIIYADAAYRFYQHTSSIPGTNYGVITYNSTSGDGIGTLSLQYSNTDYSALGVTATTNAVQADIGIMNLLGTVTQALYDTEDGITATGSGTLTSSSGTKVENISVTIHTPIFPGDNVTIDANEEGTGIVISASAPGGKTVNMKDLTTDYMPSYEVASNPTTRLYYEYWYYTYAGEEKDTAGSTVIIYKSVFDVTHNTTYFNYGTYEHVYYIELKYNGSTLEPVSIDLVDGCMGALGIVPSGATATATSGTLTTSEFALLKGSNSNYIILNNECYYLADQQHTTGILTYAHVGYNDGTGTIKYFNITYSTGAWTLTESTSPSFSLDGTTLTITGVS